VIAEERGTVVEEEREVDIVARERLGDSALFASVAVADVVAEEAFEAASTVERKAATAVRFANAVDTLVPVRMSSLYFLRNCWRSC